MNLTFFGRIRTPAWCIRAQQIGERMGRKVNPESGYENDAVITVRHSQYNDKAAQIIIDPVDAVSLVRWLHKHPEFIVLAVTPYAKEHMQKTLKNRIEVIPQQHCNFGNEIRPDRPVRVAGFCGIYETFAPYEDEIREKLHKIGVRLDFFYNYLQGSHVRKWYRDIDVQVVWRTPFEQDVLPYKNALKLYNAGSYRIPTVARAEECFVRDFDGGFVPAKSIDELVGIVEDLKHDDDMYQEVSWKAFEMSQPYHIDKTISLYKALEESL